MAAGAKHQPKEDYLPPSYHGPTIGSDSGGLVVPSNLTTEYPRDGISCTIPGTSASRKPYNAARWYQHTFPKGYTLQYVPFYAAEYTGHHWAVYDQNKKLYSFDDGDATAGDYDYDDGHDLPIGCQYLDEQPSNQPSSNSTSPAAVSGLAGAGVSGYVSAPASSPSSAVAATAAPVQARTEAGLVGNSFAPAPAPQTASVNATMASATQAAMLGLKSIL
ncbi:g11235 [Coccomyxa viridis]|uniref:G11235 protein n=1 Tax=Coccomyxa viridis TaxID=1274662 RepID=A0ABP1G7F2_9CHLO